MSGADLTARRGAFTGTGALVAFHLRRDRVLALVWFFLLIGVCFASASATTSLYSSLDERVRASEAINASPGIVALYGPVVDVRSEGEFAMTKMTVLYAVFVAVFLVILVRRHTRGEEERGLAELVGSQAVGNRTILSAAAVLSGMVALALGAAAAAADVLGGLPVAGSLWFGASWAGVGLVGSGIAAVACQLHPSGRACTAAAGGAIGVLYALRAVGDVSSEWLSWLSPFGWSTQLHAWSEPRWWVLSFYVGLWVLLWLAAAALRERRDLGAGVFAERDGEAVAPAWLDSALALSWRLHRGSLVVWTVASIAMAALFGAIAPGISGLLDSESARAMMASLGGEGAAEKMLLAAELAVSAVVLSCFGISVFAHADSDERDGRLSELIVAGSSRVRIAGAAMTVAIGGTIWLLLCSGVSMGIGYGAASGDLADAVPDLARAALDHAPAATLVVLLAGLAWCLHPLGRVAGWALLAVFLTLGELGDLLKLPGRLMGLSPYAHVPAMPVESFAPVSTAVLIGLSLLTIAAGLVAFGRRDLD